MYFERYTKTPSDSYLAHSSITICMNVSRLSGRRPKEEEEDDPSPHYIRPIYHNVADVHKKQFLFCFTSM